MTWYLVTLRLAFDDEDSLYIVQATDANDAAASAEAQLREDGDAPAQDALPKGEEARDCYVNYIVRCGDTEPIIERSAQ